MFASAIFSTYENFLETRQAEINVRKTVKDYTHCKLKRTFVFYQVIIKDYFDDQNTA